ncbi:MAG TPA: YceI family protein [Vicinamibacteria bacterium]|nr:YceI family protein [Vicinamibacteria bacterium]
MRKLAFVLAAATLIAQPVLAADTYSVDKTHSDLSFQIRHLVGKVRGSFGDFSGTINADATKPEASTVEFTIKAASIDTANEDRDKHLRSADFFEVEKFPEISFKSTKVKLLGKDRYEVTGDFSMHGVTKPLTLPVSFLGSGKDPWGNERAGFETTTTLNRKDFGIVWNKTLDAGGLVLGDEVSVSITLEALKKKEAPAAK